MVGFFYMFINVGFFVFGLCIGELVQMMDYFSVIWGINMGMFIYEVGMWYFIIGWFLLGFKVCGDLVVVVVVG